MYELKLKLQHIFTQTQNSCMGSHCFKICTISCFLLLCSQFTSEFRKITEWINYHNCEKLLPGVLFLFLFYYFYFQILFNHKILPINYNKMNKITEPDWCWTRQPQAPYNSSCFLFSPQCCWIKKQLISGHMKLLWRVRAFCTQLPSCFALAMNCDTRIGLLRFSVWQSVVGLFKRWRILGTHPSNNRF